MPETREIPLARGRRCWISLDYPEEAKPRLRPGAAALVLDPSGREGLVEIECEGRRWTIPPTHIDCGSEYLTAAGAWITEGDPLFRDWAMRELRESKASVSTSPLVAKRVERLAHLLKRNDWAVPRWCREIARARRRS